LSVNPGGVIPRSFYSFIYYPSLLMGMMSVTSKFPRGVEATSCNTFDFCNTAVRLMKAPWIRRHLGQASCSEPAQDQEEA